MKLILDTNFLMSVTQLNIDIFSEFEKTCNFKYELVIIDQTIDELEKIIAEGKGKDKYAAKIAIALIKAKGVKKIKGKADNVDDSIVAEIGAVATNDKKLIERLKGRKVVRIRAKKYLIVQ
jgi:uncharacterized protein